MLFSLLCTLAWATPTFTVEDQFARPVTHDQVLATERAVLLVSSRREHAELMDAWAEALAAQGVTTAVFGWVNLEALPFFVPKALVTRALRNDMPSTPVLCDWDGDGWAAMGLRDDDRLQVRVIDKQGQPQLALTGPPTPSGIAQIVAAVTRERDD